MSTTLKRPERGYGPWIQNGDGEEVKNFEADHRERNLNAASSDGTFSGGNGKVVMERSSPMAVADGPPTGVCRRWGHGYRLN